jgi:casein kinase 1
MYPKPGASVGPYQILKQLGGGGFSQIFYASTSTIPQLAVKLEDVDQHKKALSHEASIFQELEGCPFIPQVYKHELLPGYTVLALELMGPSLAAIRDELKNEKFSLSTTLRVGIEALRALRAIHERGIIHRDVKPDNIVVRPSAIRPIALIDFGVARKFVDPATNQPIKARVHPGFVGTPAYASVNALRGRDLGPRDDITSLVYTLCEMALGDLPWGESTHVREHTLWKRLHTPQAEIFRKVPRQFLQLFELAKRLERYETPNYDLYMALLGQAMREGRCSWDDQYDWMKMSSKTFQKLSPLKFVIPDGEKPDVPPDGPVPEVEPFAPFDEEADQEPRDTMPEKPPPSRDYCAVW